MIRRLNPGSHTCELCTCKDFKVQKTQGTTVWVEGTEKAKVSLESEHLVVLVWLCDFLVCSFQLCAEWERGVQLEPQLVSSAFKAGR